MPKKILFTITVFLILLQSGRILADDHNVGFNSGEHIFLGNNVTVFFPVKTGNNYSYQFITGEKADFREWINPNLKEQLSFGKIVATPDLFADSKVAISDGSTLKDRCNRFEKSFNVFATAKTATLDKVFHIMDEEVALIKAALQKGVDPSQEYLKQAKYFDAEYFAADPLTAELLLVGWDHFEKYAWIAYQAGHSEAIDTALEARNHSDNPALQRQLIALAYAKEAYTDHFLSDRFAAGHMRTPDKELADVLPKDDASQGVAALIALIAHNNDNEYGLYVTNKRGDHWQAFGDARYMDDCNKQNRAIVDEIMQKSVNEITIAILYSVKTPVEQFAATNLMVDLDKLDDYQHYVDSTAKTVPLFAYDAKSNDVLRRADLNALHPKHLPITENDMKHHGKNGWEGLPTLLELVGDYHPTLYLTRDGKLNAVGLHALANALTPLQKGVLCADKTASKDLREAMQCDKLLQQ